MVKTIVASDTITLGDIALRRACITRNTDGRYYPPEWFKHAHVPRHLEKIVRIRTIGGFHSQVLDAYLRLEAYAPRHLRSHGVMPLRYVIGHGAMRGVGGLSWVFRPQIFPNIKVKWNPSLWGRGRNWTYTSALPHYEAKRSGLDAEQFAVLVDEVFTHHGAATGLSEDTTSG